MHLFICYPSSLAYELIFLCLVVLLYRNFGDNAFPVINTITAEKLHKLQQDLRRKVYLFCTCTANGVLNHLLPTLLGGVL